MDPSALVIVAVSGCIVAAALWIGAGWLRQSPGRRARRRRGASSRQVDFGRTRQPALPALPASASATGRDAIAAAHGGRAGPRPHRIPPVLRDALPVLTAVAEPASTGATPPFPPRPVDSLPPDTDSDWTGSSLFPPTQPTAMADLGAQFAETMPMPLDMR